LIVSDQVFQECIRLQNHLSAEDHRELPVTLRGKSVVPVFYDLKPVGIAAPAEALPFVMAVLVGIEAPELAQLLADHPFDVLYFFENIKCDRLYGVNTRDAFSHKIPGGRLISTIDLYTEVINAFVAYAPDQLIKHAEDIHLASGNTMYALMASGLAGVGLGHLIEDNHRLCRINAKEADYCASLEWKTSIAHHSMAFLINIPTLSVAEFLTRSGALNPDYINGLMTDNNCFWEGLFTAAAGDHAFSGTVIEPTRKAACEKAVFTLCHEVEHHHPGTVEHILRSLDFSKDLSTHKVRPNTVDYIFKHVRPDVRMLNSTLFKLGLVKSHLLSADSPFIVQVAKLNEDDMFPILDDFLQAPGLIAHGLLSEITQMPDTQIGAHVFEALGYLAEQRLPAQEFSESVVAAGMLKVVKALGRFVMLDAPIDSSKYLVDRDAIQAIRDFDVQFLKPWGLDTEIFKDADPKDIGILVAAGFDLPFDGVAPELLTHRFETDLGL
jgi:hypothetical protein